MNNVFLRLIDLKEDLNEFFELIMNNTDYFSDYKNFVPSGGRRNEFLLDCTTKYLIK